MTTDTQTDSLTLYASRAARLLQKKLELEIALQEVEDELKNLQQELLPSEMLVKQQEKVLLSGGIELKLKKKFNGSISYESGTRAADILTAQGYVFNWATNIKIPQHQIVKVRQAMDKTLAKFDLPPINTKPDIAYQTFMKICRELDTKGVFDEAMQQALGVTTQFIVDVKQTDSNKKEKENG